MFDNRGVGSSTDQPEVPLSIELMADDTAGLIDALGLDHPSVVGWSTGGEIALALAVRHPGTAGELVLSGATAGGPTAVQSPPEVNALLSSNNPADEVKLFDYLFTPSGSAARDAYLAGIATMPAEEVSDTIVARQAASEDRFTTTTDTSDGLSDIHGTVVVINGADDQLVPPDNARLIAARVPAAELRIVPDAAHALMFQYPDWFVSVVDAAANGQPIPPNP
jgi:pimeloyl-ACP methyl ester carboxylesterase